ncbi:PilZ domain-containing protein [Stenotrophomonas cyclobalanopsidis]|uniref:PilZ domain-containing protein n=1 Tax=Stenotrophomonas cyclobalanopsidis TaxID=2771362 RepID=A0ABQ6T369_9GAMM|nr:PilZ domain-containing protein [Stenotrophomonas cyclobalanopsidis]KAA9001581.1 PilZ domain-containing protein [Stenotrophomonas cyclobalanopsidis]
MTLLPTTSLHHPAESELFDETLSCELAMPAEFQAGSAAGRTGSAEGLLRSLALVEDSRGDEHDERSETSLQIQRLEAKLDLTMVLLGRLVRQQGQDLPLRPVRWSRRGIRLQLGPRSGALPGQAGVVRLQPSDWLPDNIDLPVDVIAETADGSGGHFLWLRFNRLGDGLEMAMERHLFRLHRRQVAEARRAR